MRVTRITIDADLGLIELKTGPGGDGDYVLLPLPVSEELSRYIDLATTKAEIPEADTPKENALTAPGVRVRPGCLCLFCRKRAAQPSLDNETKEAGR